MNLCNFCGDGYKSANVDEPALSAGCCSKFCANALDEESERVYQEALTFCDSPAGIAPSPDCEKAIEIIRKLLADRQRSKVE